MSLEYSIAMPVFNSINTIKQAIESLISQTFTNWKLVVVDNNSNDGTYEYLDELSHSDKRIILHRNVDNIGMANNFQLAVSKAVELNPNYVTILLSDEFYESNYLKEIYYYSSKISDINFINAGHVQLFENGDKKIACFFNEAAIMPMHNYCKLALRTAHMYIGATFFRPECFKLVNGFNLTYKYYFDTDFLLRLTLKFRGAYLPITLLNRRMDSINFVSAVKSKRAVMEEYLSKLSILEYLSDVVSSEEYKEIKDDFEFYIYRLCKRYSQDLSDEKLKNEYLQLSDIIGKLTYSKNYVAGYQPYPVEEAYKLSI